MKKFKIFFALIYLSSNHMSYATSVISFDDNFNNFNPVTYNSLPSVEDADRALNQSSHLPEFTKAAGSLIHKYGFESFFGIRLLHNHSSVDKGYVMAERTITDESGTSFITESIPLSKDNEDLMIPASWILTENGYVVFEYSRDCELEPLHKRIDKQPDFLKSFHELVRSYGLETLLAPAIIGKSKVSLMKKAGESGLVEETFFDPFRSVITFRSLSEFEGNSLINTL